MPVVFTAGLVYLLETGFVFVLVVTVPKLEAGLTPLPGLTLPLVVETLAVPLVPLDAAVVDAGAPGKAFLVTTPAAAPCVPPVAPVREPLPTLVPEAIRAPVAPELLDEIPGRLLFITSLSPVPPLELPPPPRCP